MKKVFHFDAPREKYQCDAAVVWCFDNRFQLGFSKFLKRLGVVSSDPIKIAGGAKCLASPEHEMDRDFVLDQIRKSIKLHGTKLVILMVHSDCGAYGGLAGGFGGDACREAEHHEAELRRADVYLRRAFPGIDIKNYFVDFEGIWEVANDALTDDLPPETIADNGPAIPPPLPVPAPPPAPPPVARDIVLKADGGTFAQSLGYPKGSDLAMFVNRLTPSSYPARLKSVQIFFGNRKNGLAAGTPIRVVAAANPGGSETVSADTSGPINEVPATVGTLEAFNTYPVPAMTITSGDFLVGFSVANPAGVYPGDLDTASPSQKRSYISSDAKDFSLVDSFGAPGNWSIRAVVAG